jgi:hypothetical protein
MDWLKGLNKTEIMQSFEANEAISLSRVKQLKRRRGGGGQDLIGQAAETSERRGSDLPLDCWLT